MITRRHHRRVHRTNNRLRGQVQALSMTLRSYTGNPMKETERQALTRQQKFLESLKGSTEQQLKQALDQIITLEERISVLEKCPRIVRWLFGAK